MHVVYLSGDPGNSGKEYGSETEVKRANIRCIIKKATAMGNWNLTLLVSSESKYKTSTLELSLSRDKGARILILKCSSFLVEGFSMKALILAHLVGCVHAKRSQRKASGKR